MDLLNQTKVIFFISLLTDPYTEVAMEPRVAHLYTNQRARFNNVARQWTRQYAMNDCRPPPLDPPLLLPNSAKSSPLLPPPGRNNRK